MRKIQRMLGHDELATTERIYMKHSRGYIIDVANAASQRLLEAKRREPPDKTETSD